jgi:DNA-binding MarR family transcriptional regulator
MQKETDDVGFLIKKISDGCEKSVNANFAETGVTMSQIRVLFYICTQPEKTTTQKDLEVFLNVSHPTINGILRRLEDKNFITTSFTSSSHHCKQVVATEEGETILMKSGKSKVEMEKILTKGISAQEKKLFVNFLKRVLQNVDEMNG